MSGTSAAMGWVVGSWSCRRAPALYWLAKVTHPFLKRVASTWASTDIKVAKLSFSQRSSHQRIVTRSPNHMWAISWRVAVADPMVGAGDDRRQVGGHLGGRAECPSLDVLLAGNGLGLTSVIGDHDPVAGGQHREGEARLEVGLIEAGKHPVRVERLELAVEVDLVIDRVLEAVQPGTDILVVAGGQHVQLVRVAKVVQGNAGAIEGLLGHFFAVELAAVDRGCEEVDEAIGTRLLAEEMNRGLAGEGVGVAGQVERDVVQRSLDQLGAAAGFLARQVVSGVHVPSNVAGRLLEKQPLQTSCRDEERDRAQDHQVGEIDEDRRADDAGRETADQVDTVIERGQLHHELQRSRVGGDRIERCGEEEHRDQHGQDQIEILPGAHERRGRRSDRGEGEADQHGGREGEQRPGGDRETKGGHDDDEAEGVERAAEQGPGDLTERNIGDAERGGQHGIVELDVLQLVEEIERRLVDRAVHRGGRHHRRGDEDRVAERMTVDHDARAHQGADPEADREQVEQRLDEAREDDRPATPLDDRIALDDVRRAVGCRQLERPPPGQHRDHWTSRRRSVMRAAAMPIAAYTSKTARWTNADALSAPSERLRASATPCASGVSQAMPCRSWGSWWSGKKTPPSRNRGVITNRPIRAKL